MIELLATLLCFVCLFAIAWLRRRRTFVLQYDASAIARELDLTTLPVHAELRSRLVKFARCPEQVVKSLDPNAAAAAAVHDVVKLQLSHSALGCLFALRALNRDPNFEGKTHRPGVSRA